MPETNYMSAGETRARHNVLSVRYYLFYNVYNVYFMRYASLKYDYFTLETHVKLLYTFRVVHVYSTFKF